MSSPWLSPLEHCPSNKGQISYHSDRNNTDITQEDNEICVEIPDGRTTPDGFFSLLLDLLPSVTLLKIADTCTYRRFVAFKVTRPSFFGKVPSYFEAL